MNMQASAVVIGGGVMGASIAYHLAAAGVRDVILVERDELASGSTSRAAGGVRAQFSDELNIQLGARSLEAFGRFEQETGHDIGLHRVGYLFLLSTPEEVASFEESVRLQNSLGVPSRHLDVRYLVHAPAGAEPRISDESADLRWWPVDALPSDEPTLTTMVSAARRTARCSR